MSSTILPDSYVFGFADKYGVICGYHISDDLKDMRTWESIEFKFSLPDSQYMLVWNRDGSEISPQQMKKLRVRQ